jgi:hypothetical protein
MKRKMWAMAASLGILITAPAMADPSPFDLAGPDVRISVTRHGVTLPIAAVPQLAPGDKVKVEALLPADESAHYLLVAAFLRDPTNPPPPAWFRKSESWKKPGRGGGPVELTVPVGAQHLALFLAPETGGDFKTLRDAVAARPGAFVRAAQDLEQASLDRSRYDAYLAAIRQVSASAPDTLAQVAPVVAASLHIKINQDCLQRQSELQATCLLDAKQSAVLGGDDAGSSSTLSGAATDLALSLSATPAGGLGYFSPYISAIHEIVGIFGAMHTAKYQYIPALGAPKGDVMALALNTPPSFANPKSVLMAALPAVKPSHPPVLQLTAAATPPCLGAHAGLLTLPSAPLLYATAYGHDLTLRVHLPEGRNLDLPLTPDAMRGGLVIGDAPGIPTGLAGPISATVQGLWGFDAFSGPEVTLQAPGDWHWTQAGASKGDGQVQLTGASSACVASITATQANGKAEAVTWKPTGAHEVTATLPTAEPVTLTILGPEGTPPASLSVVPPAKAAQPVAQIVAHSSAPMPIDPATTVEMALDSADEIPTDARLSFTLKAGGTERFNGHETVEVATVHGEVTARLTLGSGLTLVDPGVMIATLTPVQALGASAFGPLHTRLMRGGVAGDWLPLGTLVRLPRLKALTCSGAACSLTGEGLYLLASISAKPDFEGATSVPEGYPGSTLNVPSPGANGALYVRLHDAPEVVNRMLARPKR